MTTKTKKTVALILAVCMALALLVSCGEATDNKKKQGTGESDANFPQADYEGEEFTFATFKRTTDAGNDYYTGNWIDSESLEQDLTLDAVHDRNLLCEQNYNIDIKNMFPDGGTYNDYLDIYRVADFNFDVVYGWPSDFSTGVLDGAFYDFYNLEDEGWIDMTKSYWNPTANDSLSVAGRQFIATNDITMQAIGYTRCLFFNTQIIEDVNLENPHDLMDSGDWTLDKFLELVSSVSIDTDGVAGISKNDRYGLVEIGTGGMTAQLVYGCGLHLIEDTGDDYLLGIGNERVRTVIEKAHKVLSDTSYVKTMQEVTTGANTGGDDWAYTRSFFASGHALFTDGTPEITREFRDMKDVYGIVPYPKFDKSQKNFSTSIDPNAGAFMLPNTVRNDGVESASYERTGYVLEYLAYLSGDSTNEKSVVSAYYDTTLKGQRQKLDKNVEVLDLLKGTGSYEWGEVFGVGKDPADTEDRSIGGILTEMAEAGRGINSTVKKNRDRLQKAIDEISIKLDSLS